MDKNLYDFLTKLNVSETCYQLCKDGVLKETTYDPSSKTFSIHIHCADVRKERAKLLDLLSHTSSGDTDATQMLKASINLLESKN